MKIYIDHDCKCHMDAADGRRAFETDFFDGKCAEFIEGYRYVPLGESWTREGGEVFRGEMIAPWRDHNTLLEYQAIYERMLAEAEQLKAQNGEYEAALTEIENALGVTSE